MEEREAEGFFRTTGKVLSPLLHLLGEVGLELGGLLRVVDLQVEVDAGGGEH